MTAFPKGKPVVFISVWYYFFDLCWNIRFAKLVMVPPRAPTIERLEHGNASTKPSLNLNIIGSHHISTCGLYTGMTVQYTYYNISMRHGQTCVSCDEG